MEVERQNLAEAVTLAERKHSDEKKRVDELQQQVKVLKSNLDSSKQELADYKQKATRILQVSLRRTCVNVQAGQLTERLPEALCRSVGALFLLAALAYFRCLVLLRNIVKKMKCFLLPPLLSF